jgi:hypothetical protein
VSHANRLRVGSRRSAEVFTAEKPKSAENTFWPGCDAAWYHIYERLLMRRGRISVAMKKIEIRRNQVYRLVLRQERGSRLAQLLRRLLPRRH